MLIKNQLVGLSAAISLIVLLLCSPAGANLPPLPPSQDVVRISEQVAKSLEENDPDAYSALISDDVRVIVDNDVSYCGKSQWLNHQLAKMNASGVKFKILKQFAGPGNFIHVLYFNSQGSFAPSNQECCENYQVVKYFIKSGEIVKIIILSTGNVELDGD